MGLCFHVKNKGGQIVGIARVTTQATPSPCCAPIFPSRSHLFFVFSFLFFFHPPPSPNPQTPTPIPTMFWTQSITPSSKKTINKNTDKTHRNALLPCNRILDIKELRDLISSFLPRCNGNGKLIYLSSVLV